jgi:hypothetical protein
MKKQLFIFLLSILILAACGGDSESVADGNSSENIAEEQIPEPVIAEFKIDTKNSSAKWERTLDQKPTKQKVKLFGKMVDVELGEVKLNTNGSVSITNGGLSTTDDQLTEATVVFDMASFKFAKEKGSGLFDVTQHPNSTLVLKDFNDSTVIGDLTIQETTSEVVVNLSSTKTENTYTLEGNFTVNTLNFPLREKVKAKDINKDEIKVNFTFIYVKP